ncbi:Na(+)/H(+) antiporter [Vitreoscilla sp. C1]|uniref:cation:proton antiporter n=1 Tax=Vitreoscilla sp. (strain C1) TaxID=96942 RepID=UPI001598BD96|nr:cation:proton antiporter [Vitreoscilla sp. C1]AUZ05417.2 Na(+)/H(+) antiporter [Vitreoscilla sp. C1]
MGSYSFLQMFTVVFGLSIATTLFNKRVLGLPAAIGVPIVSAVAVFLLQWAVSLFGHNDFVHINIKEIENAVRGIDFYDFLINGVICFILTSSALKFKISDLKTYFKPIAILASIALALCAVFFGLALYGYQIATGHKVGLLVLLLLGAALGATDPIGIKGVLSSVKAPHHLMVKLEGESLFNDAVCIALFMTILAVIKGGEFTVVGALGVLAYEIVVAVIIGLAFGWFVLRLLKGKHEMESLILSTAFLASGSYLVALYAHASGPIACVIAGLVVGNRWQEILSEQEVSEVNHFWHTVEGIINSFLCTLIGMELFIIDFHVDLLIGGVVAFVILHLARFAANFLAFVPFRSIRRQSYNGSLTILSWGGVRGGISLALILAVANMPPLSKYSDILIGYTFVCVLLSGLVCGLGLPGVMNAFYYNPDEPKTGFSGWY